MGDSLTSVLYDRLAEAMNGWAGFWIWNSVVGSLGLVVVGLAGWLSWRFR